MAGNVSRLPVRGSRNLACGHRDEAAYIQGWLAKFRNDKHMVVIAAAQAQKAADYILNATPGAARRRAMRGRRARAPSPIGFVRFGPNPVEPRDRVLIRILAVKYGSSGGRLLTLLSYFLPAPHSGFQKLLLRPHRRDGIDRLRTR
jgi:hypothetical protein